MQEIPLRFGDEALSRLDRRVLLCLALSLGVGWLGTTWALLMHASQVLRHERYWLIWPFLLWLAVGCLCFWVGHHCWRLNRRSPLSKGKQVSLEGDTLTPLDQPNLMTPTEQELLRYSISHDLRAPLRVIDGFARILKDEEGPRMDRMSNEHLDRLLAAAGRMNTMIDAVLAQAQLTQSAIERETVDLSAIAHQVAEELAGERQSELGQVPFGLGVTWTLAAGMVATGDPDLLRRVLENLMGNAVKYSSKVPNPKVEVGMVEAADPKVYFVRDNGAGFDMQHAQKLFGLFQRLHSSKEFPGSGVGLAGVQIIVRRHGGRIWAESQPGQGACFYFTLSETRRS
jgi:light-regulated signal transduction histidine kinase (bacteriophytochrome)